ncbi:DUF4272 domain-containing protein [Methyloversatilis discipulorum]|uniref:DUF4272 domain-containing protein n=1 Tax=Methyloversatilis discipulorum TaxID=1119528 RepID=UPI0022B6B560|nr:DUF4272 domain-containing protein [Methyloversatilis discipulorum]
MTLNVRYQMEEPYFDEGPEDEIRDAGAIARRALALFAVISIAFGDDKQKLIDWLRAEDLWAELSPEELDFITSETPSERQVFNASWRSEALLLLLWSLGLVEAIPAPSETCNPALFRDLLPPRTSVSVNEFIASARRRSDEVLVEMADEILNLHWEARDASINGRECPEVHIGIIQERHHGINWAIGYGGSPWDEVATDT